MTARIGATMVAGPYSAEGVLSNPTVIGPICVAIVTIMGTLLALWVRRTDRATRLTSANMDRMQNDLEFYGALHDDYWDLLTWANDVRLVWRERESELREQLPHLAPRELPPLPLSRVRLLDQKRKRERDTAAGIED